MKYKRYWLPPAVLLLRVLAFLMHFLLTESYRTEIQELLAEYDRKKAQHAIG